MPGDQVFDRIDHFTGIEPARQVEVREGAAALHCQCSFFAHMDASGDRVAREASRLTNLPTITRWRMR